MMIKAHHPWLIACALATFSLPASAATAVTWDLESPAGTNSGGSNYGNIRTFTASGGQTLTVTAFGSTASTGSDANGVLQTAYTSQFSGGLGVCNRVEGICPDAPNHALDTGGRDDFLLFDFGSLYQLASLSIGWFQDDADIQVWIGTDTANVDLVGKCIVSTGSGCTGTQTLADLGFVAQGLKTNVQDTGSASFSGTTPSGRYALVSGASGLLNSSYAGNDKFKVSGIAAYSTPTPGTLALFGIGLIGILLSRQRSAA